MTDKSELDEYPRGHGTVAVRMRRDLSASDVSRPRETRFSKRSRKVANSVGRHARAHSERSVYTVLKRLPATIGSDRASDGPWKLHHVVAARSMPPPAEHNKVFLIPFEYEDEERSPSERACNYFKFTFDHMDGQTDVYTRDGRDSVAAALHALAAETGVEPMMKMTSVCMERTELGRWSYERAIIRPSSRFTIRRSTSACVRACMDCVVVYGGRRQIETYGFPS